MKKKGIIILSGFLVLALIISTMVYFSPKKEVKKQVTLKKVTLAEVAHTVFYAPIKCSDRSH